MMRCRALLSIFAALTLLVAVINLCVAKGNKPRPHVKSDIPKIAQILGVQVGKDTIEALEKKLGPGATCKGGHPDGGRMWAVKDTKLLIYADGFDYANRGRVIDTIRIGTERAIGECCTTPDKQKVKIPTISLRGKFNSWLGGIMPGMTKQAVLEQTGKLPKPEEKDNKLIWTARGSYSLVKGIEYKEWAAELTFYKDKLILIDICVSE